MSRESDEAAGGIRWQTSDAADALLSDVMSDVSQDAIAERRALEEELRRRDDEGRRRREDEERRQSTEIEQRLREEEARRAAADEQRRRLMREAEIARAVERGEINAEEARRLIKPEPVAAEHTEESARGPHLAEAAHPDTTADPVTAPGRGPVLAQTQPSVIQAPAPPPKTRWAVTAALCAPLVIAAAVLALLLVRQGDARSAAEMDLAKARTESASLKQQVAAMEKKLEEQKGRYAQLQERLDDMVAAAAARAQEPAAASVTAGGTSARASRPAVAPPKRPAQEASAGDEDPRDATSEDSKGDKKKAKRKFDLGESIFEGGKDGKIVF